MSRTGSWDFGSNDPGGSWGRSDHKGNKFNKRKGCGKPAATVLLLIAGTVLYGLDKLISMV